MKEYTNKEVIDKLVEYYLRSDPAVVARSLANAMIDFRRILRPSCMTEKESSCLRERLILNDKALTEFIVNDKVNGNFELFDMNSNEDNNG